MLSHPYLRIVICCLFLASPASAQETASEWVHEAMSYWRDTSSYTKASMIIHRPSWQRTMALENYTLGMKHSLVRFTKPAKDAGSASLKVENDMWSYSPKINRVIKIPGSMMQQSWMGSDFSYNDLARDDDIIEHYTHSFLEPEKFEEMKVYVIESLPHEHAPVAWGKEILKVREDKVILEHAFYDQDMALVKRLVSTQVGVLGGKNIPIVMRMENIEKEGEWTEITHLEAQFDIALSDKTFTLSNLRNPREHIK